MTGPQAQAERTALSWTRTSLAVLANGVLLVLKEPHRQGPLLLVAAGLAGLLTLVVFVVGVRRQRTLARRPLPDTVTARVEVQLIGACVLALIVVAAVGLFV